MDPFKVLHTTTAKQSTAPSWRRISSCWINGDVHCTFPRLSHLPNHLGGAMRQSQSKAEGMSESTRRTSNTSGMLNQQEEFYFFKWKLILNDFIYRCFYAPFQEPWRWIEPPIDEYYSVFFPTIRFFPRKIKLHSERESLVTRRILKFYNIFF